MKYLYERFSSQQLLKTNLTSKIMPFNLEALEELIEKSNVSVGRLARGVGINREHIYRIRSGENTPRVETIDRLYQYAESIGLGHLEFYGKPVGQERGEDKSCS